MCIRDRYDSYWGLIIPRVAVAGSIFMMRAAFSGIPKELAEAARIDGLSEMGIFWRIMMPQVKPAAITLIILSINAVSYTHLQNSIDIYDEIKALQKYS